MKTFVHSEMGTTAFLSDASWPAQDLRELLLEMGEDGETVDLETVLCLLAGLMGAGEMDGIYEGDWGAYLHLPWLQPNGTWGESCDAGRPADHPLEVDIALTFAGGTWARTRLSLRKMLIDKAQDDDGGSYRGLREIQAALRALADDLQPHLDAVALRMADVISPVKRDSSDESAAAPIVPSSLGESNAAPILHHTVRRYLRGAEPSASTDGSAGTALGTAPSPPPDPGRMLRLREVEALVGLSRDSIYRLARTGKFPRPVKVSERASRWRENDLRAYLEERRKGR